MAARLGLGMLAWAVESVILIALLLILAGIQADSGNDTLGLLQSEAPIAMGMLGALAVLAWAWGAPSFAQVGLDNAPMRRYAARDVLVGLMLGPIAVGVFLQAGLIGGWDRIISVAPAGQLLTNLALGAILFFMVGLFEELLGRGCLLALLARLIGLPGALVVSVIIFAGLHAGNPGAGPFALVGVGLAGLVFAFALLRTGALWLPIAFHLSWDWAETSLYGYPDSGIPPQSALQLAIDPTAPQWATGGAFGPEASAFVLVALALASALIWLYTRSRAGAARAALFPLGTPEREARVADPVG